MNELIIYISNKKIIGKPLIHVFISLKIINHITNKFCKPNFIFYVDKSFNFCFLFIMIKVHFKLVVADSIQCPSCDSA